MKDFETYKRYLKTDAIVLTAFAALSVLSNIIGMINGEVLLIIVIISMLTLALMIMMLVSANKGSKAAGVIGIIQSAIYLLDGVLELTVRYDIIAAAVAILFGIVILSAAVPYTKHFK